MNELFENILFILPLIYLAGWALFIALIVWIVKSILKINQQLDRISNQLDGKEG